MRWRAGSRSLVPGRRALAVVALLAGTAHADVDALVRSAPGCAAARATCIGISLHVASDDAGAPIATPAWLAEQLAAANHHFEPLDVGFRIVAADTASVRGVATREDRDALRGRVEGAVVHVFVTGRLADVDRPGEQIRGVTWRRGDTKFVIVSTIAMPRVLAHELGHVFGLPHSAYAISIMNKTERTTPPVDQRTFADPEYGVMRVKLASLLRAKALANVKQP